MRLALMSRWNATCGVSLHAELLGRKLRSMGHEVVVYAPTLESAARDWHHKHLGIEDEPWIKRVYEETDEYLYPDGGWIDSEKLLEEDYEALIVELYTRLPVSELKKISAKIKGKAKLIGVLHLGYPRDIKPILEIEWDAITIFDKRCLDELLSRYVEEIPGRVEEIPYPFAIVKKVQPIRPEFAEDKIFFFTFGRQPDLEYVDYIRALRRLSSSYDLVYLIVRSDGVLSIEEDWLIQRREKLSLKSLYSYLKGSDLHLLPKNDIRAVVVSSTLAQTLYSGAPTITPDTRHFELIPVDDKGIGPIVKYRLGDTDDLVEKLKLLIDDEDLRERVSREAKAYALENSDEIVASRFIELIKSL